MPERPKVLITAPFRGAGLERMRELADVILDPWIDHEPMRIYGPEDLAERLRAEGADILICEADFCSGPVFEQPLRAIASTRGDPTNVDIAQATEAGVPVLLHARPQRRRGRRAHARRCCSRQPDTSSPRTVTCAPVRCSRAGPCRTSGIAGGRSPVGPSASWATARSAMRCGGGSRRSACGFSCAIRTRPSRHTRSTICSPNPTS